jgi:hypothetical protein
MLFIIIERVGVGNLIIGIVAIESSDSINADSKKGKFDFSYQWRNSEVSATAWSYLRMEG